MLNLINSVQKQIQLRHFSLKSYSPEVQFSLEQQNYIIKTADQSKELLEAFALRYKSFYKNKPNKLDVDRYDQNCDHLVIIHKETQKIIGTYRLNHSTQLQDFYSQSEFNLQSFVMPYSRFLELGRACIHPDHRTGSVISLLWKGIYIYMKKINAEILFGCTSIKHITPRDAALVHRYFIQNNLTNSQYSIKPHRQFRVPFFEEYKQIFSRPLTEAELLEAERLIPSLLKTYIKLGAQVIGEPAYDSEMDTIDFLTSLKVQQLDERYQKRFDQQTA